MNCASTRLAAVCLGLLALAAVAADGPNAPEPVVRIFTADELPGLARGFALPRGGGYSVLVWAPARQVWSLASDGSSLTLSPRAEGQDASPRWQRVGAVNLKDGEPVKVAVAGAPAASEAAAKPAPAAQKKRARPAPPPPPVPALLVLTTDPDFDPAGDLDLVRGRVDSAEPSPDARRTHVRTNEQGADFRAPATEQAWRDRARAVREQLLVALGLWPMPPKAPLRPRVVGTIERDGYTIEKVVLETLPGFTLSGNVFRPSHAAGRLPAVLCPHGHWADGRVNPEVQHRCIRLAKLGAVAFMYDMVGYNDSKPFGHSFLNDRLRRWGLSLVTLQTWNSLRAVDYLTGRPDVDPARIGCTGESGGGTQTFLLTAIDDRVKVAAPVVMVSEWFQGGCACENCAGLRWGTDNVEIAALAAPRPMKLVGATGDWTARTMTNAYPAIRSVYALLGRPERLSADVFNFPHNYNQTSRNAVYPFLARWLFDPDEARDVSEGDQTVEAPDDLHTFTESTPGPAHPKTPRELEDDLVRTLTWELAALAPAASTSPSAWEAARARLATSQRARVGLVNPPPAAVSAVELRRSTFGAGARVVHLRVGRKGSDDSVPVVRLTPGTPNGRLTVIANPRGKAALADTDGRVERLARALLKRGQGVVLFDPLFVGESVDPSAPTLARPETTHFDTYNPSVAADQMQDLATVLAWARSLPDVRSVSLAGLGLSGAQALVARPALEGLARTFADLDGFDPRDGSAPLPPALDLPGLLQFGGPNAAAALAAPAPLWLARAGQGFDPAWPEAAYDLAGSRQALRLDPDAPDPDALARWLDTGE